MTPRCRVLAAAQLPFFALLLLALPTLPPPAHAASPLKVQGSTTVNPVVARAAEVLRDEQDMEILVDTQGGSSGGIAALGDGRIEVAMASRPIDTEDRSKFPGTDFHPVAVGLDALVLAVSRDVWEGGVRSLSRREVQKLYEGKVRNWSELGGPDRRIVFFNKEPGRGTWEVFVNWLYGDADDAPLVALPEVGSNEEGRTKVGSTRGAVTQLSLAWIDGETIFAVPLRDADGEIHEPSLGNLRDGSYPLSRSLYVITDGEPSTEARQLIDFLLGPRGQEIVRQVGYLPLAATAEPGPGVGGDDAP